MRRAAGIFGWGLLLFVVLFWRLGEPTFWDPDEAHYAETTRELIATGDWTAPFYNEQPFFDKPVFFHLLQAIPMRLLGPTETAARLIPALAALALVGITAWLARRLSVARVASVAALLLVTSPGLFALARYAILDTLFTALMFGGAALVTVAALEARPRLQYGGYLLIALAVLTKGPLAMALCGLTFALALAGPRDLRERLLGLRWLVGLAMVVAISAPWFIYMWLRFDGAFVDGYVLNENVKLFSTSMYAKQPPWWFYFRILAAGLLPWTPLLAGRLYDDARAIWRGRGIDAFETLLWAWTAAVIGFFTLSQFKLDHYVFPVAPALCVLCARAWVDLGCAPDAPEHRGARVGLHLVGPVLLAAALGAGFYLVNRLSLPRTALAAPIAIAIAGMVIAVTLRLRQSRPPAFPIIIACSLAIAYGGLVLFMMPALEQRKVVPDLARWVHARADTTTRVAAYRLNRWNTAWRFYVDRHTAFMDTPDELRAFLAAPGPFYCGMTGRDFEELVADGVPLRVVYERQGMWATSGKALWRHQSEATRFVVVTRGEALAQSAVQP